MWNYLSHLRIPWCDLILHDGYCYGNYVPYFCSDLGLYCHFYREIGVYDMSEILSDHSYHGFDYGYGVD